MWPFCVPHPITFVTVIPVMPISFIADLISSNLAGLNIITTFDKAGDFLVV